MAAQGGIPQELTQAEQKASQIVAEARAGRNERIKEAKKEAEAIINAYRAEKEAAYQQSLQSTLGSSGSDKEVLRGETQKAIKEMTKDFETNKQAALEQLVKDACAVQLVVPEGLRRATY